MMLPHPTFDPEIELSWKQLLTDDFKHESFISLRDFLVEERARFTVFPLGKKIFQAFNSTPVDKVKVVIIGQDPYHGPGQAHGLCFSVPEGIKPPPSLKNIFKELKSDIQLDIPSNGNLQHWADEGVLLLNATLTVRAGQAGSHQGKGWEVFTDSVISKLSSSKDNLVFLLWGRFAQDKAELIDPSRHCLLKAAHPSPFQRTTDFLAAVIFQRPMNISSHAD